MPDKKHIQEHFSSAFRLLNPLILALFICLAAIRIHEFVAYQSLFPEESLKAGYLIGGLLIDLVFAQLVGSVVLLLQSLFLMRLIRSRVAFRVVALIVIFATAALSQTFLQMHEPVDEVIYSFSLSELSTITGGEIQWFSVVFTFILLPLLFFAAEWLLRRVFNRIHPRIPLILTVISLGCTFLLPYESEKWLATKIVNNKLVYFGIRSWHYSTDRAAPAHHLKNIDPHFLAGQSTDPAFPLMHRFDADPAFADLFQRRSGTPPNLVFIIVESLSTRFFGQYAQEAGPLMPFLDSLSGNSLYFPHIISTADRTYNVLPAIFSSTPNAPEGKQFMELKQPHHWAMMDLLRREYYSRFYCGVYLGFNHMHNYLGYHETDYMLDDPDWEPDFNRKFDPRNTWGYPDDQLFSKYLRDTDGKHRNIRKARLDILLTISTHSPYIIPNGKAYRKQVIDAYKKIKRPSAYHQYVLKNPEMFAAYTYTDASLKQFFAEMKKRPDYGNTIFFILGDHGPYMNSPGQNELSRATTPLLIVSELIKKPQKFEAFSSHLDVLPSVLSLLQQQYAVNLPEVVPFMGKGLRLQTAYGCQLHQPISNPAYSNKYLLYGEYYLAHRELFRIRPGLQLQPIDNAKLRQNLTEKMKQYEQLSTFCITQDHLLPYYLFERFRNDQGGPTWFSHELVLLNSDQEYIRLGNTAAEAVPHGIQPARLSVQLEVWLDDPKDAASLPSFVAAIQHKDSLVHWAGVEPDFLQPKHQGWNKIRYDIRYLPADLKSTHALMIDYYLWHKKRNKLRMRRVTVQGYGR